MTDAPAARDRTSSEADRGWVLVAALRGETAAFLVDVVLEVFPLDRWTPVPGSPPFVVGVVARRGAIYGVLDIGLLRAALALPDASTSAAEPLGQHATGLLLRTTTGGLVVPVRDVLGLAPAERIEASQNGVHDPLAPSRAVVAGTSLRLYDAAHLETLGRAELRAVALSARA